MASKRMTRREIKRTKLQDKALQKRAELTAQLKNPELDIDEKFAVIAKLEGMPRDTSRVRARNRCSITGRPRGTLRKFGLCRTELRRRTMLGEIPGLVKASW